MELTREEYMKYAKLADQLECYEEMFEGMVNIVKRFKEPLNQDERNYLAIALKNMMRQKRSEWHSLEAILSIDKNAEYTKVGDVLKEKVGKEVKRLCTDVTKLIDEKLLKNPENVKAEIFFLKMKGDYYRYMTEVCSAGRELGDVISKSNQAYEKAWNLAVKKLPTANTLRLGLALNFSTFFYEVKKQPKMACKMAEGAIEGTVTGLDSVSEDDKNDISQVIDLLRDNLTLWRSEMEEFDEGANN